MHLKLASFKEEQPSYRSNATRHVGAAVFAHVAHSAAADWTLLLDERSFNGIDIRIFCTFGHAIFNIPLDFSNILVKDFVKKKFA